MNYFLFSRFYDNGEHIALTSEVDWLHYFWQQGHHQFTPLRLRKGVNLWQSIDQLRQINGESREKFNIDYKFEIVVRGVDYYDIFGFGAPHHHPQVLDMYVNHLSVLKTFTLYFMEQGANLISVANKPCHRLTFPAMRRHAKKAYDMPRRVDFSIGRFHFPHVSFSKREMQSLAWVLRGRTAKQIGQLLNISHKTVESYIEVTKQKLACQSRSQLFDKAYETGIIDIVALI